MRRSLATLSTVPRPTVPRSTVPRATVPLAQSSGSIGTSDSLSRISLAGSGTISVKELISLPTEEAIRILNEISYPDLDQLFNVNPALSAKYRPLYENGIREALSSPVPSPILSPPMVEQLPVAGIVGRIPDTILRAMGIRINIISMRVLLDWWLLYFLSRGRYFNGMVNPDEFTNQVLGPYYRGLSPRVPFQYRYLVHLFLPIFTQVSNVRPVDQVYLRRLEEILEERLKEFHLSATNSVPDFINSVITFDEQDGGGGEEWSELKN